MGWHFLATVPAALILIAGAWTAVVPRLGRRVAWYRLEPSGAPIQWDQFKNVVASTRRWLITGRVMIARVGADAGGSDIWVGIAGSKQPSEIAQSMARAAGAQLGNRDDPPVPNIAGTSWRAGFAEPAPGRREKDATEEYLRALDQRTIPEQPSFPEVCADCFRPGDAFIVMAASRGGPTRVQAMCVTTNIGLDMSFSEASELRRQFLLPSVALLFVSAAAALSAAAAIPLLPPTWLVGAPPSGMRTAIAVGIVSLALAMFWTSIRNPPLLAALRAGKAPRFPRAAAKGRVLPVWQLGEWAAGDARSGTSAPMKLAPAEALTSNGALIGEDPTGQECRLPDEMRYRGTIAYGDPGMGKTTLILNLLAHDCERRSRGEHLCPIWIETKGEGAQRAFDVMRDHGVEPLVLSGMIAAGPRLELVDRSKPVEAGHLLTDALRYAFDVDDIHEASADVLRSAFEAAVAFPADAAREIGVECAQQANIIELAFRILNGIPEITPRVHAVMDRAVTEIHRRAVQRYWKLRDWERERVIGPGKNKLSGLTAATGLFEPFDAQSGRDRPSVSSERILERAQPTIIHLGRGTVSDQSGSSQSHASESIETGQLAQRTAAMSMFVLWHTIQNECDGWQAEGKSVSVFSDELKDISGFGKPGLEVVQAMADQGRSRGVLPSFGTQRPDQLVPSTRAAVDSFSTQAYFQLRAREANEIASDQLFGDFTSEEIAALPEHWCALSIAATGRKPATFTLHPRNL